MTERQPASSGSPLLIRRSCPACGREFSSTREALACWLQQRPDLAEQVTLREIGDALGVTRERVRQLLNGLGERRRRKRVVIPVTYTRIVKAYSTKISPEARDKWRVYQRNRYRENPDVRAEAKRRYEQRWANDPTFREAHRRRARERYWRLRALRDTEEATE